MSSAPPRIVELVETFDRNIETYHSQQYNETKLRREFIDPFFEELGWDISNKQGCAPAYRDVIHEDAVKVGTATKAPDYGFCIGGVRNRKFFLEAKKPAVDIKNDCEPAYQLRRYAWSAKLPLSVLTDFEEFAVYDCLIKPKHTDRASVARIMYLTYKEYADRWDEIAATFSKDAVLKGSFDRFAATAKGKHGTTPVDVAFLDEIEKWRRGLAQTIAHNNRSLSKHEMNFAVQRTIDRILFLRMCEDRGIEQYKQLDSLTNGNRVYPRLCELFERADKKYNSGLFHFQPEKDRAEPPDELTLNLVVEDPILKLTLSSLYYPQCPYEFYVIPPEILGNVYEQFLGRVITVSPARRVSIDEKPEVKKAGGVYYTPSYIVDYIVQNTVSKLYENKTPKDISKLKILDPACGSGSFLLGAYTYLLDYHRDWYIANDPAKYTKQIYQLKADQWHLTIAEKKKILLNNIFGVDIDSQAVEVTKLSLLLKVLEGESKETVGQVYKMFHERALPDLGNNIKCGNSLIGPDFFDDKDPNSFDEEQIRKINPFDWHSEFPQVFSGKNPGFDAVIGNPPWGALFEKPEISYLVKCFPLVPTKTKDSYLYFISKALAILCNSGFLGFITPNTWLLINNAKEYRRHLLSFDVKEIVDYGDGVFKQATVESSTIVIAKSKKPKGTCRAVRFRKGVRIIDHEVNKQIWFDDEYLRINVDIDKTSHQLIEKLLIVSQPFENNCTIIWGIKPYQVGYGIPPQTKEMVKNRIYHSTTKESNKWKSLLVGSGVDRYKIHFLGNAFIKYGKWLMYPSNESLMLSPKILMRQTSSTIRACYDDDKYYCQNSVFVIHSKEINLKFLLGLLNSKLMGFVYKLRNPQAGKVFAEVKPSVIKQLPIRTIDFDNPDDKTKHNKMVKLVDQMLDLHKKLTAAKVPDEKTKLQRQISTTDSQIDKLVYNLYNLTEEEIAIVEGRG